MIAILNVNCNPSAVLAVFPGNTPEDEREALSLARRCGRGIVVRHIEREQASRVHDPSDRFTSAMGAYPPSYQILRPLRFP